MKNESLSEVEKADRLSYSEGIISMILNVALFVLKLIAGLLSGSVALMADAWHTLSDSLTSLVIIVGTAFSRKPADDEHPFGHGRAELVSSVVIGVLLAAIGVNFLIEAIQRLNSGETATFRTFSAVIFGVSVLVKEGLAQYAFFTYRRTGRRSLRADGWHHRSDAIASLLIVIGIFLGRYAWWIDGVLGIVVALLILYAAWDILRDTVQPLLGESPGEADRIAVAELLSEGDINPDAIHHLHIHRYGDHAEVTFHLRLDGRRSLTEAHDNANWLEELMRERLGWEATIHIEPRDEPED